MHQRSPVYRYLYNASFVDISPPEAPDLGAFHGSLEALLYSQGSLNSPNATKKETELKAYMRKAWGAFVRDPKRGPGWTALDQAKIHVNVEVLGNIGSKQSGGGKLVTASNLDAKCQLYQPIYEALIGQT